MAYTKEVTSVFSDLFTNLFVKKDFSENKWAHSLYIQPLGFCYNVFVRSIDDTFFLLFLQGNTERHILMPLEVCINALCSHLFLPLVEPVLCRSLRKFLLVSLQALCTLTAD